MPRSWGGDGEEGGGYLAVVTNSSGLYIYNLHRTLYRDGGKYGTCRAKIVPGKNCE